MTAPGNRPHRFARAWKGPADTLRRLGQIFRPPAPPRPRRWAAWLGQNWARVTFARKVEPTWLELTHHDVPIPDLPKAFDGCRIVQLSDVHAGRGVPATLIGRAVELARDQRPDLIALTGDFIHAGKGHVEQVASILARLRAPLGVWAVLGNHDYSVRNAMGVRRHPNLHRMVAGALERHGIPVLRNRSVPLRRGAATLYLVGVEDLWSRECDIPGAFAAVPPAAPAVLLAHNPLTVTHLGDRRADLTLSGHTHGGQVNWPGLGRFFLTKQGRRFAAGMYRNGASWLYVHRGVGYGWRIRFNVRPEVAVLVLRRAAQDPQPPEP
jgi:predicted MPP superfamily phosphohydrolase